MTKTYRYRFVGFHDYDIVPYTNNHPFTVVQQHNPYDIDISCDDAELFHVNYAMTLAFKFKRLGEVVDGNVVEVPEPPEPGT